MTHITFNMRGQQFHVNSIAQIVGVLNELSHQSSKAAARLLEGSAARAKEEGKAHSLELAATVLASIEVGNVTLQSFIEAESDCHANVPRLERRVAELEKMLENADHIGDPHRS